MDTHANPDLFSRRPWVRHERLLHLNRRGRSGARRRKHREERVALRIDLLPAVRREASPDERVVTAENVRVGFTQTLQQRRRAFNVREKKRERLRGQSVRDPQALCPLQTPASTLSPHRTRRWWFLAQERLPWAASSLLWLRGNAPWT
jgi:hypothetical protein